MLYLGSLCKVVFMYCIYLGSSCMVMFIYCIRVFYVCVHALCLNIIESVDSISRDEQDVPLTQYITNA